MKKLSTILIKSIVENFSKKDTKYILAEIIKYSWENLSEEEKELVESEMNKLKEQE